jgi:N-acetyl-anhydromuramyl-L-alanine amidase AmpD
MVEDKNTARHAQCYNQHSIGIEHEGFDENPDWYTNNMYRASARLTAWCCKRHRIPVDRNHILGHTEVPGITKPCPGRPWNWAKYMRLVRAYRARM